MKGKVIVLQACLSVCVSHTLCLEERDVYISELNGNNYLLT